MLLSPQLHGLCFSTSGKRMRHQITPKTPLLEIHAGRSTSHRATFICLLLLWSVHPSTSSPTGGATSTIPRSTNSRHSSSSSISSHSPPWNPSPHIDSDGFLATSYYRLPGEWEAQANLPGKHGPHKRRYTLLPLIPVTIRQVPGDGNCLFHSIAATLSLAVNRTHVSMSDTSLLRSNSALLRAQAVDCLSRNPRRVLFLQGSEYLRASDLVSAAAAQYDLSGDEYCAQMRQDSRWGGGPEIVALCNVLKRPIHVYELTTATTDEIDGDGASGKKAAPRPHFKLRRMVCFGSPKFDRKEPLCILSADSRFPDLQPGKQMASGNHFLAMFPAKSPSPVRRVRGGSDEGIVGFWRRWRPSADPAERKSGVETATGVGKNPLRISRKVRPSDGYGEVEESRIGLRRRRWLGR